MLQQHFLEQIVNVQWASARDLVMAFGVSGSPQFFIKFTTPKASYAVGATLPAPTFGAAINVPTDTRAVALTPAMPVNNTVVPTAATISVDHKAYTEAALREWVGEVSTLTGQKRFYNPKGVLIPATQVPEVSPGHKGKSIFRDDDGVIYAQATGLGGAGRVYKLDSGGEEIWTIGGGSPLTVNLDDNTDTGPRLIIPGHESSDEINFYNTETGALSSSVTLPANIEDVSREGKAYIFTPTTESTWEGIKGFTREGVEHFSISGENFSTGTRFLTITAYGEDYIVVTGQFPQVNEFSFSTVDGHNVSTVRSTIPIWLIVYNANTGAQVSKTLWGNDINTVNTDDSIHPPGEDTHSSTNRESYASVSCFRSEYLPERPEEETA